MGVRIKGLVKFADFVKRKLRSGVSQAELPGFFEHIQHIVEQVEEICESYQSTPKELPTPSRRAYFFLKNLKREDIPINRSKIVSAEPELKKTTIKNLVRLADVFSHNMWVEVDLLCSEASRRQRLHEDIATQVKIVDGFCASQNIPPANLNRPSRYVYCWLKYLLANNNLSSHLATLNFLKDTLPAISGKYAHIPIEIHLVNTQAYFRARMKGKTYVIKFNEGFINAPGELWRSLLKGILSDSPRKDRSFVNYVHSEEFSSVLYEMESFAEPPENSSGGHVHDLDASFKRINQKYFQGKLKKPRLQWNHILTVSKYGHYQANRDIVMISISLDHPEVPDYVVDFVMYHELLHKKLGASIINGRRFVHTPEFRRQERQFTHYHRAMTFLKEWSMKQRR